MTPQQTAQLNQIRLYGCYLMKFYKFSEEQTKATNRVADRHNQYLFDVVSSIREDFISLSSSVSGVTVKLGEPEFFGNFLAEHRRAVIKETLEMNWTEFGNWLETCLGFSHVSP